MTAEEQKKLKKEKERKQEELRKAVNAKRVKEYSSYETLKSTYSITGKLFEQTECLLRFTFFPLMLLTFAFAFSPVLGVVFPALLVFNYTASKIISNSFKDDFKDESEIITKAQNAKEAEEAVAAYEQIPVLQQKLDNLKAQNAAIASAKVQETLAKPINAQQTPKPTSEKEMV